ncbi:hypothetical protein, partial [Megasphaera sp. BL7]|uniref:hypothetical protein n=1 Tax=Megasphaera sp. BL7 TaxID=1285585 RepID=UPI00178C80B2
MHEGGIDIGLGIAVPVPAVMKLDGVLFCLMQEILGFFNGLLQWRLTMAFAMDENDVSFSLEADFNFP